MKNYVGWTAIVPMQSFFICELIVLFHYLF